MLVLRNKLVYVAGPLNNTGVLNGVRKEVSQHVRETLDDANEVARLGFSPFVPHLYHFWDMITPHPRDFWLKLDLEWLEVCGSLVRRPGPSAGADMEAARMRQLGGPVFEGIEDFSLRVASGWRTHDELAADAVASVGDFR